MAPASVESFNPPFMAAIHSWINSPAWAPMIWQPSGFPLGLIRIFILPRGLGLRKGTVVFPKEILQYPVFDPCPFRPFLIESDTCHLWIGIGTPWHFCIISHACQMQAGIGQCDPSLISGHMGEGKLSVHIPTGIDMRDICAHARVRDDPFEGINNPSGIKSQVLYIGFSAGAHNQCIGFQDLDFMINSDTPIV